MASTSRLPSLSDLAIDFTRSEISIPFETGSRGSMTDCPYVYGWTDGMYVRHHELFL